MQMRRYLFDTFQYNDYANKLALGKIKELPEKAECVRFFSHLINSMNKWLARIEKWGEVKAFPESVILPPRPAANSPNQGGELKESTTPSVPIKDIGTATPPVQKGSYLNMDWWLPVYELDELEQKWDECLARWLLFLDTRTDEELNGEVDFIGYDGTMFAATIKDIALQLNYHSIHHRAQIQYLIRQQGLEPEFVDYIGTKYRRLNGEL